MRPNNSGYIPAFSFGQQCYSSKRDPPHATAILRSMPPPPARAAYNQEGCPNTIHLSSAAILAFYR
eukprot:805351-Lingulodinium_polyedra.AAC.1